MLKEERERTGESGGGEEGRGEFLKQEKGLNVYCVVERAGKGSWPSEGVDENDVMELGEGSRWDGEKQSRRLEQMELRETVRAAGVNGLREVEG